MNLLYFTAHQMWPLTTGARLRDYNLARNLAARCSVTFVEMCRPEEKHSLSREESGFQSVVTLNKSRTYSSLNILRGMLGPTPVTVLNCWSVRGNSDVAALLRSRRFDSIQIEGVHLTKYLPLLQNAPGRPAILVDWHNIESELMWRFAETTQNRLKKVAARRTAKLIERTEDEILRSCSKHTVVSEREKKQLLARCPEADVRVIPNGIEANHYAMNEDGGALKTEREHKLKSTILFVGSMDYHANIDAVMWFAKAVWPEIARNHRDLIFTIVGRDPAPDVRRLASDRIQVTGTVTDVRPFYTSALAVVVPLRTGGGTRLKILEAMAVGVPIVSTTLGAEGIDAEHDSQLLLANTDTEFVAALERVIRCPETRSRLSKAGRQLAASRYDWSGISDKLYGIHHDLVKSRRCLHSTGSSSS